MKWNNKTNNFAHLHDFENNFSRLDKDQFCFNDSIREKIRNGEYSDYHALCGKSKSDKYICDARENFKYDSQNEIESTIINSVYITQKLTVVICSQMTVMYYSRDIDGQCNGFSVPQIYFFKYKTFGDQVYDHIQNVPKIMLDSINSFIPVSITFPNLL